MVTKKGAGGKQQPYIPSGNGDKSGEYTSFDTLSLDSKVITLCKIIGCDGVIEYAYKSHVPPIIETAHLKERLEERKLTKIEIADALLKPLYKSNIKFDEKGRPSMKYYGREATVCVNPTNGKIITVYKTRKNIRNKYKGN